MSMASLLSFICLLLLCATPVGAVSNLVLAPGSGSTYVLSGRGVEGAAAIECTITYDTAVYGNPRVELGALAAGAMAAVNPNTPGMVRIAIMSTTSMNGSGPIATISFDRKGESSGKVNILSAKMLTLDEKQLSLAVQVFGQPETETVRDTPPATVPDTAQRQGGASVPGSTVQQQPGVLLPTVGGGIAQIKQEEKQRQDVAAGKSEKSAVQDRPAPAPEPSRIAKRDESTQQTASRKIYSKRSVLDRFREFRGKPTVASYVELFEQEGMIGFRQDPPVVLADGKSTVRVSFISSTPTRTTSDIAVMGAALLSLKKDPDYTNSFILELQPEKGELRASVSVPQDNVLMVFPLTLAPKKSPEVGKKKGIDEAAFNAFLSERGSPEHPKYDLNNDGKRDYIDDYIFTANYIAGRLRPVVIGTGR